MTLAKKITYFIFLLPLFTSLLLIILIITSSKIGFINQILYSQSTTPQIKVLVLSFFPDLDNDGMLDTNITGAIAYKTTVSLPEIRERVNYLTDATARNLTKGSAYHQYKNPGAVAKLDYSISETKEFLKPVPQLPGTLPQPPDHTQILKREGFDICHYVENFGVKEVWIWMYHSDQVYPVESYQYGPNGGLGNGVMNLPLCSKTYTVYDYNYSRTEREAIHDHMHHLENLFNWVNSSRFLNQFAGVDYQCCPWTPKLLSSERRCGNCHFPPNKLSGHENRYTDEAFVMSDCEYWQPSGGHQTEINCHNWNCAEMGYYNWWMQNIPPVWWQYVSDFDQAVASNIGLPAPPAETPASPNPSSSPSPVCSLPPEPEVRVVERQNKSYEYHTELCHDVYGALCTNDSSPLWQAAVDDPASPCNIASTEIWENPPGEWTGPYDTFGTEFSIQLSHNQCKGVNFKYSNLANTSSWPATPWVKIDIQGPPPATITNHTCLSDTDNWTWTIVRNHNSDEGCSTSNHYKVETSWGTSYEIDKDSTIDSWTWTSGQTSKPSALGTYSITVYERDSLSNWNQGAADSFDYPCPSANPSPSASPSPSSSPSPSPSPQATPSPSPCPYDLNTDRQIDDADLSILYDNYANLTNAFILLAQILTYWGSTCP